MTPILKALDLDHIDRRTLSAMPFVYIVRCADGTLYTGYAVDPKARAEKHNTGRGAKYTASRRPVTLVYSQWFKTVGAALKREYAMKQWTRAEKEALVARRVRSKQRLS